MKQKIGIDLDKTVFDCKSLVYNFVNTFHFNKGQNLKFKDVERNGIYKGGILNKVFKMLNPKSYFTYPNAVETINKLSDAGMEVHLVSNRPAIKPVISMTLQTLRAQGIKFDKLILGCNNKLSYARQENLNFFVDNVAEICEAFDAEEDMECFFLSIPKDDKILKTHKTLKRSTWSDISDFFEKKIEEFEGKAALDEDPLEEAFAKTEKNL